METENGGSLAVLLQSHQKCIKAEQKRKEEKLPINMQGIVFPQTTMLNYTFIAFILQTQPHIWKDYDG